MKYVFELCKGRHTTPAENAIFSNSVNPTDVDALFDEAWGKIPEDCDALDVYVTGLTVAMLAVVKVCEARQIDLTAYHFDRDSGKYYSQLVLAHWRCSFCGARNSVTAGYCGHCGAN